MLDLRRIREDPDGVKAALARRGPGVADAIDDVLALDGERRSAITRSEALRSEQKAASEEVAAGKREGRDVSEQLEHLKGFSAQVKDLTSQASAADERLQELLRTLPNLTDPTAAEEDTVVREVGEAVDPVPKPRDHLELAGERIDMERGARLSGSRFAYLRGELVLLELALVRWALDVVGRHGFQPVIPPVLVREQALFGTGMLPDTEQQIYHVPADDLYLVGTSEVALASLHAEEILDAADLPVRYAGFSPCFRREAGAAGRDTRGLFRVHQFDKVEMFSFVAPDESAAEHERILGIEEEILGALGIPYRVVNIAVERPGRERGEEVRPRGVAARAGPLPRADVVLEHDRLPGPAARHPDAPRGRPAGDPAHAERHRGRRRAHDHRPAGERPARGRLRRAARGAGAVRSPRRPGGRA